MSKHTSHSDHHHGQLNGNKLWLSLVVTAVFVVGEALVGWRANSLALLSDAGHNLSDAVALGLAAYAADAVQKLPTARHTYGFHRVSILAALFNAATLIAIAAVIFIEACHRFSQPGPLDGRLMIWVGVVAMLMNTVIAALLADDAKHSLNSRAAFVHMTGDALSSLAVVVAGITFHYTGWVYADPVASLMIAAFILYSSVGICRESTGILMEACPAGIDSDLLINSLRSLDLVKEVHDLHIWQVGDSTNLLSCHVMVPSTSTLQQSCLVVESIKTKLHDDFNISHATIEIEAESSRECSQRTSSGRCVLEPHIA